MQRNFLEVTVNKVSYHYAFIWRSFCNSCSVDVRAIKNALLKHQQIYSKIPTVGAVQVLLGTPIFRNTWECFLHYFFLIAMCQARIYSLCFYLFLQKIRRPVLFSTSWLLLIVIDKFANRNSCGYCFRRFGKFPRERLQWSSQ